MAEIKRFGVGSNLAQEVLNRGQRRLRAPLQEAVRSLTSADSSQEPERRPQVSTPKKSR